MGRKKKDHYGTDSMEQIQACLHCTRISCSGNCSGWPVHQDGKKIPIPDDFERIAKVGATLLVLAQRYGVSENTIIKWKHQKGLIKGKAAPGADTPKGGKG